MVLLTEVKKQINKDMTEGKFNYASCVFHFQVNLMQYTWYLSAWSTEPHIDKSHDLTLKAPITTAADDKFCDIFPNFRKK